MDFNMVKVLNKLRLASEKDLSAFQKPIILIGGFNMVESIKEQYLVKGAHDLDQ